MPGDNVFNLAVIFGYRYGGTRGSLAAVQGAMRGTSAVVAGLPLVTGIKLMGSQPRAPRVLAPHCPHWLRSRPA